MGEDLAGMAKGPALLFSGVILGGLTTVDGACGLGAATSTTLSSLINNNSSVMTQRTHCQKTCLSIFSPIV